MFFYKLNSTFNDEKVFLNGSSITKFGGRIFFHIYILNMLQFLSHTGIEDTEHEEMHRI